MIRSINRLKTLRKTNLSTTQFDDHNINISSSNKLNLARILLSRDNNETLNNSKEIRI